LVTPANDVFDTFIPLAPEKKFSLKTQSFFNTYVVGVVTSRDTWVYNFSKKKLSANMTSMIEFYDTQRNLYHKAVSKNPKLEVETFIGANPEQISWSRALRADIRNNVVHSFDVTGLRVSSYRSFCKQNMYFDKTLMKPLD
jgi:predicted helicase